MPADVGEYPSDDPRFAAAVDLIGRAGADQFMMRYSDEDGQPPLVWVSAARFDNGWECAAAMNPLMSLFRLCDALIDGGMCVHCRRPTGFVPDIEPTVADALICWYQWDPELSTFRRGCAGNDNGR
jgi:hypothetical protein